MLWSNILANTRGCRASKLRGRLRMAPVVVDSIVRSSQLVPLRAVQLHVLSSSFSGTPTWAGTQDIETVMCCFKSRSILRTRFGFKVRHRRTVNQHTEIRKVHQIPYRFRKWIQRRHAIRSFEYRFSQYSQISTRFASCPYDLPCVICHRTWLID